MNQCKKGWIRYTICWYDRELWFKNKREIIVLWKLDWKWIALSKNFTTDKKEILRTCKVLLTFWNKNQFDYVISALFCQKIMLTCQIFMSIVLLDDYVNLSDFYMSLCWLVRSVCRLVRSLCLLVRKKCWLVIHSWENKSLKRVLAQLMSYR